MPAITSFTISSASPVQLNLNWSATDSIAFDLDYSMNGTSGWVAMLINSSSGFSFNHTGLNPDTRYYYRVRGRNAGGQTSNYATANETTQKGAPQITTAALPNAILNAGYSQTLTIAQGTAPFAWDVLEGRLPLGLSLNAANGAITGTAAAPGTFTFTVRVIDSRGYAGQKTLSINVPVNITAAALTTPFNQNNIRPTGYEAPPSDWEKVIDEHEYQDGGRSTNANNSRAPRRFYWIFQGLSAAQAAVFDAHYEAAMGRHKDFPFTDRSGTYYEAGTYYESFETGGAEEKVWSKTRRIVLIRFP